MSIRYVQATDLDTDQWDKTLKEDPRALIYATSWYLDTLGEDWDALVLGDYEAMLPIVHRKKFRQSYIFRPTGVQQLGLHGKDSDSPELLRDFLNAIPSEYRFIDLFTNAHNSIDLLPKGWKSKPQTNLLLDLEGSYEHIYGKFSSNTRRNIRKSAKNGFRIFEYDSPEVLITLFRNNQGTRYKVTSEFYQRILHLMHVLIHKRRGAVWTIHDERNSPIAGIFVMEYKDRATLLFTATDELGRESHALTFLINEYLVFRSGHLEVFDFEGSNVSGIQRYYAGFGAREDNYEHLSLNRLPWPIRWLK